MSRDDEKRGAAEAALKFIEDGSIVGVGTGSTVAFFIEALARMRDRIAGAVSSSERSTAHLRERGIETVWCVGLATDFCVGWTAEDAVAAGFEAVLIEDASRAINANGSVMASAFYTADRDHAFVWTQAGGIVDIGTLPGATYGATAYGISADGSVVSGTSSVAVGELMILTQPHGLVRDLKNYRLGDLREELCVHARVVRRRLYALMPEHGANAV